MTQTRTGSTQSGEAPVKEELKQDAQSIKQSAEKRAETEARRGRDQAVDTAKATSSAIDRAADELRRNEDAPDWLASMLGDASSQIEKIAGNLNNKEPREMVRDVERFGRDKPAAFLAASAAAGFAAGRYLRAGAEQHDDVDAVEPGAPIEGRMDSSSDTGSRQAMPAGTSARTGAATTATTGTTTRTTAGTTTPPVSTGGGRI